MMLTYMPSKYKVIYSYPVFRSKKLSNCFHQFSLNILFMLCFAHICRIPGTSILFWYEYIIRSSSNISQINVNNFFLKFQCNLKFMYPFLILDFVRLVLLSLSFILILMLVKENTLNLGVIIGCSISGAFSLRKNHFYT